MTEKKRRIFMGSAVIAVCLVFLCACATATPTKTQKEERQIEILTMANETMDKFYQENPDARDRVAASAGFAVFSNSGYKFLILGSSKGAGIAVDNFTKQETFMKMFELQPGLGIGAEKFWLVFIFDTPEAFIKFISSGWEVGVNASAAAKSDDKGGGTGGEVTAAPGVHIFRLTEKGLIAGVGITGARFYPDKDLNRE